jgi:hypothetical protein
MKQTRMLMFLLIGALLSSAAPAAPAESAAGVPDPGQKGPYEVGFEYYQVVDVSRNAGIDGRPIAVYAWYPVDPSSISASSPEAVYSLDPYFGYLPLTNSSDWEAFGIDRTYQEPSLSSHKPFPLVMYSTGWTTPATTAISVATRLASHGFVVAVLYYYGDGWWAWEPQDHLALTGMNRPLDVSFVLDDLLIRNQTPGDLFFGSVRPDQVAASGHSLGGYASLVLAGGDDLVCDSFPGAPPETCRELLPDPRIKAIVTLSGGNQFLRFYELARIRVPAMGIGEEWSTLISYMGPGWASWQARQHAAIQGHPCYRVDVVSAIHETFMNACEFFMVLDKVGIWPQWLVDYLLGVCCTTSIPSLEAKRLAAKYMIAFLKTELVHEQGYQHILTPGYALNSEEFIEFFVTEKRNPNSTEEDWPDVFWYFPHQPGSEQFQAEKDPAEILPIKSLRQW